MDRQVVVSGRKLNLRRDLRLNTTFGGQTGSKVFSQVLASRKENTI